MMERQDSPGLATGGRASVAEVAQFDAIAGRWWDKAGPMAPLHAMNPLRIAWITRRLSGPCRVLDVGCGAGIATEALAQAGHTILGLDAARQTLIAAQRHAEGQELPLRYRLGTTEDLVRESLCFDAITALELIEHVPDQLGLLRDLAALLKPGGSLFISTLNRTLRSMLVAKLGAEYVARLLPTGTHDWRRFMTPGELARDARSVGLRLVETAGMTYDLATRTWTESRDLKVNFIAALVRTSSSTVGS